jgi:RNA polymerase sigma-70 factor (ECF subfamily)
MDVGRRQQIQSWIVRFADGERDAFQLLFEALWPVVLAFTSQGLPNPADAEDAAQQAVMKVFSRIADFDRSRDGLGWVLGIAGYEVMTIRKQRLRRREIGAAPLSLLEHDARDTESRMIAEELRLAVLAVVGDLPARDREALATILLGDDAPSDETARKRRFRAMERLRAAWRRAHG